jgi:hypothetical protein
METRLASCLTLSPHWCSTNLLQQKPPVVIGTDFDVKPGSYLVRLVVRDAEGQQITAENAAVQVQ